MNLKAFSQTILAILGISEWPKSADSKSTLTAEQEQHLQQLGFSEKFLTGFKAALANDFVEEAQDAPSAPADGADSRAAILQGLLTQTAADLTNAQAQLQQLQADAKTSKATIAQKEALITSLQEKVNALSRAAEDDPAKVTVPGGSAAGDRIDVANEQQLMGLAGAMYGMDRAYNVRARAALLERQGQTVLSVPKASSIDYSRLNDDLGAFYRVKWQDRLQSFLTLLPTIETIFPVESGYQDLATLANIWLGEFSQADNSASDFDNVVKGTYEFDDETLRMFDVMFAHRFKNLKQLEKSWIGSLNAEGSQAIKWSFIEYILAETAKKLHNERELRRINGVRKNPKLNEPGEAMNAADGIYEFLRKKIDGYVDVNTGNTVYQIKPFQLGEITMANIGEKIFEGTSMIPAEIRDSGNLCLYIPSYMLVWYHKYNELHYGTNQDYKPDLTTVKEYPQVRIKTIPNADNHQRIFWTLDGNIHCYEHVSGEMYNFSLEQEDWSLKVWSQWKESIWAVAVGFKYTKKADMDGTRQMIWANEYDLSKAYFVPAAKDVNPDASLHKSVVTVANTSLLAITDITGTETGDTVILKCGSVDKGVTIAKSGNFSLIKAAWTPAVGDTITLMKRADGKFIELGRSTAATDQAKAFEPDDTTPSVADGTVFVVGDNTQATAITSLDDAVEGETYTIYGAGSTNASTIANSGKFVLTAAMTLSAGKMIRLVAVDGKFYEVERS